MSIDDYGRDDSMYSGDYENGREAGVDAERERIIDALTAESRRYDRLGYDGGDVWLAAIRIAEGSHPRSNAIPSHGP